MDDDDQVGGRPLRGVVEVEWEGWEDDRPRSKVPWIVGIVLAVSVVAVAALTWWATGTDAELGPAPEAAAPEDTDAAPPTEVPAEEVSLDALRAAIPDGVEGCVPPPDQPDGPGPDGTVRLECPESAGADLVTFTLFADVDDRDHAFADTVALLELDPGAPGDCVLGGGAVHDYVGDRGRGTVACRDAQDRVDIAWTDGTAPVLAVAGGFGSYPEHYEAWSELVGRSDGEFPLPPERALLDQLPAELTTRCDRDPTLARRADGIVAITCTPAVGEATEVSWVRFADADAMTAWIEAEQAGLAGAVTDTTESACRPDGRGPSGQLPPPWLGATPFRQDTTTGTVLCHVDEQGRSVITWSRAGVNIGSVARSDSSIGDVTMADLADWWEEFGPL